MWRALLCAVVATGAILLVADPANAGGTWLEFERESYQPGDEVRASATVSVGQLGWVEDGPFHARLRTGHSMGIVGESEDDIFLGPASLANETTHSIDVTVVFTLPDVQSGEWWVVVCNEGCEEGLGDLIGGIVTVSGTGANDDPPTSLPRTGTPVFPLLGAVLALLGFGGRSLALASRSDDQAGPG